MIKQINPFNVVVVIFLIVGAVNVIAVVMFYPVVAERQSSQEFELGSIIETAYGTIQVKDKGDTRGIYIDGGVMGEMSLENRFETVRGWEYIDCLEDVSLIAPAEDVLVLGVGAGLLPSRLSEKHEMQVDAVDINEKVFEAAEKYFGFETGNGLTAYTDDARMFLKYSGKKYDYITMDIFKYRDSGYIIPEHLVTKEFFSEAKKDLKEGGAFAIAVAPKQSDPNFFENVVRTMKSVWRNVYVFRCGVKVIVASDSDIPKGVVSERLAEARHVFEIGEGLVYSDGFVPINLLGGS